MLSTLEGAILKSVDAALADNVDFVAVHDRGDGNDAADDDQNDELGATLLTMRHFLDAGMLELLKIRDASRVTHHSVRPAGTSKVSTAVSGTKE